MKACDIKLMNRTPRRSNISDNNPILAKTIPSTTVNRVAQPLNHSMVTDVNQGNNKWAGKFKEYKIPARQSRSRARKPSQ